MMVAVEVREGERGQWRGGESGERQQGQGRG